MQCQSCGAPAVPGLVMCRFCKRPVNAEAAEAAIPCPQCATLNVWGTMNCVQCRAWVVVQCVFCAQVSPHNQPACLSCGEAFAGALERKVACDNQMRNEQFAHNAGIVGQVAAPFLGAVAGSMVGSYFGSHHHSYVYEQHDDDGGGSFSGSVGAEDTSGHFSDDDGGGSDFFDAGAGDFGGSFSDD